MAIGLRRRRTRAFARVARANNYTTKGVVGLPWWMNSTRCHAILACVSAVFACSLSIQLEQQRNFCQQIHRQRGSFVLMPYRKQKNSLSKIFSDYPEDSTDCRIEGSLAGRQ